MIVQPKNFKLNLFHQFAAQGGFLTVYFLALFAEWVQGPYEKVLLLFKVRPDDEAAQGLVMEPEGWVRSICGNLNTNLILHSSFNRKSSIA